MIHTLDQDNSSDVNESQPIDMNSINFNNHASNDCESPSGSDSIATRVRARDEKARKPEGSKFTKIDVDLVEVDIIVYIINSYSFI